MLSLDPSLTHQDWQTWLHDPRLILAAGLFFGSLLLATGGIVWLLKRDAPGEILISCPDISEENSDTHESIIVDVEGAVNSPGVYSFSAASRVADAIQRAGGVSPDVDQERLETELNLAMQLEDQQKIFVPRKEEATLNTTNLTNTSLLVNINTASNAELEELPGIGAKRAADLIQGRPYRSLKELELKQPIPVSLIKEIEKMISF